MKNNKFMYFDQILDAVYMGLFNEMILQSQNGTDRAIINYLFSTKCSLENIEQDLGIAVDDCKRRLINIAKEYDRCNATKKHESFTKRGR